MGICKKSYSKIQNLYIPTIFSWLIICIALPAHAQTIKTNQHGLAVIEKRQQYLQTVAADSNMRMVNLKETVPGLVFDMRYSSSNNFMGRPLYKQPLKTSYLRAPAAFALQKVQEELTRAGLGLKIWDAYRPYSVTEKMWEQVQDNRYAADPKFGSGHNRGIAVDLTLIDLQTGMEKDMGTGYDNFSDTAHAAFKALPDSVISNRNLLIGLMEKNGFKVLDTEWWHFYLPDNKKYLLMDLRFKDLETVTKSKKQQHNSDR